MGDKASRVRVTGPLTAYSAGFAAGLTRVGYTENATADQVRLLAHLSRWLGAQRLAAEDISPEAGDAFLAARRAAGYTLWLSRKALAPLLQYLRGLGAVPPLPVLELSPTQALLVRFCEYLASERGLKHSTTRGYSDFVRPFLRRREGPDGTLRLGDLSAVDITAFVVAESPAVESARRG
jgi:hypothetical protein